MLTDSSVFSVELGFVTARLADTFSWISFRAADRSLFSLRSGIPIRNSSVVLSVEKIASSINWLAVSIGVLSEGLQSLYKSLTQI